jgi:SAM-dependent methyltransferase
MNRLGGRILLKLRSVAGRVLPPYLQRKLKPLIPVTWRRRMKIGFWTDTEDRRILEETIIPELVNRFKKGKILFVGCAPYTQEYPDLFKGVELWTLEPNPEMRRFGAKHHVVSDLESVKEHFKTGYFDAIICNGVLGHGLNLRDHIKTAMHGCYDCLKLGGILVLGWNDLPETSTEMPVDEIVTDNKFADFEFQPFRSSHIEVDGPLKHHYRFLAKPFRAS